MLTYIYLDEGREKSQVTRECACGLIRANTSAIDPWGVLAILERCAVVLGESDIPLTECSRIIVTGYIHKEERDV